MSDSTDKNAFDARCHKMWASISRSTVERWKENIAEHPKSYFLGYLDLNLVFILSSGQTITYRQRGIGAKVLNGKAHLEFPSELGKDGKHYATSFPCGELGGELRACLTALVFTHPEIDQAVKTAGRLAEAKVTAAQQDAPTEGVPELLAAMADSPPAIPNPFDDADAMQA